MLARHGGVVDGHGVALGAADVGGRQQVVAAAGVLAVDQQGRMLRHALDRRGVQRPASGHAAPGGRQRRLARAAYPAGQGRRSARPWRCVRRPAGRPAVPPVHLGRRRAGRRRPPASRRRQADGPGAARRRRPQTISSTIKSSSSRRAAPIRGREGIVLDKGRDIVDQVALVSPALALADPVWAAATASPPPVVRRRPAPGSAPAGRR